MPRFAANLTFMFSELPFLDRFEAAAEAGFQGVEFLFVGDLAWRCPTEAFAALRRAWRGLRKGSVAHAHLAVRLGVLRPSVPRLREG